MVWGRCSTPSTVDRITTLAMVTCCPLIVLLFFVANYGMPTFSLTVLWWCLGWILFQMGLSFLPDQMSKVCPFYKGGWQIGHKTPAGFSLEYNVNGLQAWIITHALYLILSYTGIIKATVIIDYWGEIFISANIVGFVVSILAYLKSIYFSSYPEDNKKTGYFIYDFVMGVEFNPRVFGIDLKLFFNGRPGIIAWTLINLSFMMVQYEKYGYITDSMIIVNILQAIYVLDFFWNENWYLHTIDIAHDHFGWMLGWADCAWLPFMYTLQCGYLMNNPVDLGFIPSISILAMGIVGYVIFRVANFQKDYFRKTLQGKYIECEYTTGDGKLHKSRLIYSGLWGYARHLNYTGDIILSFAYCLPCGFSHLLPYFYSIYMCILLGTRCIRDEDRCQKKYGTKWIQYCQKVPYRYIPGIL